MENYQTLDVNSTLNQHKNVQKTIFNRNKNRLAETSNEHRANEDNPFLVKDGDGSEEKDEKDQELKKMKMMQWKMNPKIYSENQPNQISNNKVLRVNLSSKIGAFSESKQAHARLEMPTKQSANNLNSRNSNLIREGRFTNQNQSDIINTNRSNLVQESEALNQQQQLETAMTPRNQPRLKIRPRHALMQAKISEQQQQKHDIDYNPLQETLTPEAQESQRQGLQNSSINMLISKPERSTEKSIDVLKEYKMDKEMAIRLQQEKDANDEKDYGSQTALAKQESEEGQQQRLSTFDAEAMDADADLIQVEKIHTDDVSPTLNRRLKQFQGTQSSFVGKSSFGNSAHFNLAIQNSHKDQLNNIQTTDFDDDYEITNRGIDESIEDRQLKLLNQQTMIKKQLTDIEYQINSKKRMQSCVVDKSSARKRSDDASATKMKSKEAIRKKKLIDDEVVHDDLFTLDAQLGNIDDRYRSNTIMADFKIVYIDMTKNNEQELRLSEKKFEFMPRDILQFIGNWSKQFVDGKNDQNVVSLDLSHNHIQELEGSLFMHLGSEGCKNIKQIKAHHNQIRYISSRIKDCFNLETLRLSHNELSGREFIPSELLNSPHICQSLQYLYLAHNDIRELPIQLNNLKNLRVLDLENNKIRQLQYRQSSTADDDEPSRGKYVCAIGGLENLEELYLGQNRLKDLPTVFQNFKKMKIVGLDWFSYIAQPLTLPKIVEDNKVIAKLRSSSQFQRELKKNQYMTFRQFAKGFTSNGKYDIDGGQDLEEDGRTALHLAVAHNDQAMVNNLLKEGANPNLLDNYQYSPLGLALNKNLIAVSKLILKFSQRINFKTAENSRLLLLSIEKLDIDLTEELLRHGCDPNLSQDPKTGENCLHLLIYKLSCTNENARKYVDERRSKRSQETKSLNQNDYKSKLRPSEKPDKDRQDEVFSDIDPYDSRISNYDTPIANTQNEECQSKQQVQNEAIQQYVQNFGGKNAAKISRAEKENRARQDNNDSHEYLNDHKKCLRILDSLLLHGMNVNLVCNQKYTPFLLAVRLGNVFLTQKLIQRLMANYNSKNSAVEHDDKIDLNMKGGYGQNTAYHLAATRTNFEILFELDRQGADVFIRNKDNKTCFQLVNNNLLMLKIVKKIERKQHLKRQIQIMDKIQPPECKIVVHNNMYVNTGEFRQFDETLQRIKKEFLKAPVRRPSIFSSQTRGHSAGGSQSRHQVRNQSQRAPARTTAKKKPKKVYLFEFLNEYEREKSKEATEGQRQEARRNDVQGDYSPQSSQRLMLNMQASSGKMPQSFPKMKGTSWGPGGAEGIKLQNQKSIALTRTDSANVLETDRMVSSVFTKYSKEKNSVQEVDQNQHRVNENAVIINGVQLNNRNYDNYNKNLKKGMKSQLDTSTQSNTYTQYENIQEAKGLNQPHNILANNSVIHRPTDEMRASMDAKSTQKILQNQNHKNIFFIKDQLFDKERIRQVVNNRMAQNCLITNDEHAVRVPMARLATEQKVSEMKDDTMNKSDNQQIKGSEEQSNPVEILEYRVLPSFKDSVSFGVQANRQTQEVKLVSQLRSIFNPQLKTHIKVVSEIIEKLYKLKSSPLIISQILQIAQFCLQNIGCNDSNSKLSENQRQIRNSQNSYANATIRAALESLQENVNCPQSMQEEVQDVIDSCQFRRKKRVIRHEDVKPSQEQADEPYNINIFSSRHDYASPGGGESHELLPSHKMMKYLQDHGSARQFEIQRNQPVRVEHGSAQKQRQSNQHSGNLMGQIDSQPASWQHRKFSHQAHVNPANNIIKLNSHLKDRKSSMIHQRKSNAMISHQNKNPLTNNPVNSHPTSNTTKKHNIPTITKVSQPIDLKINLESLSQIAIGQSENTNVEKINKKIDEEFSKNITISNEQQQDEKKVINDSPALYLQPKNTNDHQQTDLENTQTLQLKSFQLDQIAHFNEAKSNSNQTYVEEYSMFQPKILKDAHQVSSKTLPQTARESAKEEVKILNLHQVSIKSLKLEKGHSIDDDSSAILETIVLKRSNVSFKRPPAEQAASKQKVKIKIRNSVFDQSNKHHQGAYQDSHQKRLPSEFLNSSNEKVSLGNDSSPYSGQPRPNNKKALSSKKLNTQNIQKTQFIPSSKNSPREPSQAKHSRQSSKVNSLNGTLTKPGVINQDKHTIRLHQDASTPVATDDASPTAAGQKFQEINKSQGLSNLLKKNSQENIQDE